MSYQWYEDVPSDSTLQQGDIIEKCVILVPSEQHYQAILDKTEDTLSLETEVINGIVLSQSCDIVNDKIDSIIVCPIWSLKNFIEKDGYFKSSKGREDLRQGKIPEYHLLQKFKGEELPEDFYFVDFHRIYSVPKNFVQAIIKNKPHKRLLPPYREHLSQSFARYFMRVGLPVDIPKGEIEAYS